MTAELDVRRLLLDAAPAALLVALISVLMSSQIDELDGKVIVLILAGLVGVGLSALVLHRQPILEPVGLGAPATAPVALQPDVVAGRPKKVSVVPVVGSRTDGLEAFSLPKEGAADDENEDSFVVHQPTGTIAVSDGASSSFGSRIWSRALVDNAISDGSPLTAGFVGTIMGPAAKKWKEHHEVGELPWWAVEGLRRGGFATLLVVRIGANSKGRAWQALAVGDSCVFHLRAKEGVWQLLRAFPLESAEAFGSHPLLLSSVSPAPVEGIEFAGGQLRAGDMVLAATDAVSEWLLGDATRLEFAATAPIADVAAAVSAARQDRSMVNDDATFVRYREGQ